MRVAYRLLNTLCTRRQPLGVTLAFHDEVGVATLLVPKHDDVGEVARHPSGYDEFDLHSRWRVAAIDDEECKDCAPHPFLWIRPGEVLLPMKAIVNAIALDRDEPAL